MATCATCGRALDTYTEPDSADCGGDCLRCMAEAGDPECMRQMNAMELPYNGKKPDSDLPRYPEDYPCY